MENFIQITVYCPSEPRLDAFVYRNAEKVYCCVAIVGWFYIVTFSCDCHRPLDQSEVGPKLVVTFSNEYCELLFGLKN